MSTLVRYVLTFLCIGFMLQSTTCATVVSRNRALEKDIAAQRVAIADLLAEKEEYKNFLGKKDAADETAEKERERVKQKILEELKNDEDARKACSTLVPSFFNGAF